MVNIKKAYCAYCTRRDSNPRSSKPGILSPATLTGALTSCGYVCSTITSKHQRMMNELMMDMHGTFSYISGLGRQEKLRIICNVNTINDTKNNSNTLDKLPVQVRLVSVGTGYARTVQDDMSCIEETSRRINQGFVDQRRTKDNTLKLKKKRNTS